MSNKPCPAPAPRQLMQMLRIHAWKDEITDDCRQFHEWSADTIEQLMVRCVRLSQRIEKLEAAHERA